MNLNKIYVMTYNVSWESLEGVNSGRLNMSHCKKDGVNNCSNNIAQIICLTSLSKNNGILCDFIGLQEINQSINQWKYLKSQIKHLNPNFLKNYTKAYTQIGKAGIITLYNKKYTLKFKIEGNLNNDNDIRPFHILIFDQNIIYINLHMPHNNQENALEILQNNLSKIFLLFPEINFSGFDLIIGGDFNNNNPLDFENFKNLQKIIGKKILREKNKLLTCCSSKKTINYNRNYDHIFSNLVCTNYNTLNSDEYFIDQSNNMNMSDHLPVFAVFVQNINYLIEYDNL